MKLKRKFSLIERHRSGFTFVVLILLSLAACKPGSDKSKETDVVIEKEGGNALYEEVIDIHDEIMPNLARIAALKSGIEDKISSLEKLESPDDAMLDALRQQMINLDIADEAMMDWMRSFNMNQEGWARDSLLRYLERQKKKITNVGLVVDDAIRQAEEMIEEG